MRSLPALLLFLAACGGPPAPAWPDDGVTAYTAPLVEAWKPDRPLVEVWLDGRGPLLFTFDTARRAALSAEAARLLDLTTRGHPARGRFVEVDTLRVGALELHDVTLDVVEAPLGYLHERPVAGAIGPALLPDRAWEYDRARGVVRVHRDAPPPAPDGDGADQVPLERLHDGRWHLEAEIEEEEVDGLLLATGEPVSALRPAAAEAAELNPGASGWRGRVRIGSLPAVETGFLSVEGDLPTLRGVLGFPALGPRSFRLYEDRLWLWYPKSSSHLARFELPDCGPGLARCVRGRIGEVEPGRVRLDFDRPEVPLPPRFWARIRFGDPRADWATALVQLDPRPNGLLRAVVEDPAIGPRSAVEGTPVKVVDVVPLGVRCAGDVCVRR